MEKVIAKPIAPYRPRRAALNWVDLLVIAATALTFFTVLATNTRHAARAQVRADVITSDQLPDQSSQLAEQPGLLRARIGAMRAGS